MRDKNILVFGGGELQKSLILQCKRNNLNTIVCDPDPDAPCKILADSFEIIDGNDFDGTCEIVRKHSINAIITAATDKPLVMMARVAEFFGFPFFSEETALLSTNKSLQKHKFIENGIHCAKGYTIQSVSQCPQLPFIMKPADSSGSRGVRLCRNTQEAESALREILSFSKQSFAIAEELIEGSEYSIESLHFNGKSQILQITEKTVTPYPFFVETSHIQPAKIDTETLTNIISINNKIAAVFNFNNCASHNEIKINEKGIFVIEVSPRLGGDKISSHLVPLSTGINMEQCLIEIALGQTPEISTKKNQAAGIFFFIFEDEFFPEIYEKKIEGLKNIREISVRFHSGTRIPEIQSSHDRYGYIILSAEDKMELLKMKQTTMNLLFKKPKQ